MTASIASQTAPSAPPPPRLGGGVVVGGGGGAVTVIVTRVTALWALSSSVSWYSKKSLPT